MKFIKKHKNKLFILMLTLISALTLFLNIGKTYAYTYDETTNSIVSDNLISINDKQETNNGITYKIENGTISISGSISDSYNPQYLFIEIQLEKNIPSGTYSINWFNDTTNDKLYCYNADLKNIGDYTLAKILTTTNASASGNMVNGISQIRLRIEKNYTYNITIKPMIVSGTTVPTQYEPYGTFINETLYNDLQDDYTSLEDNYNTLEDNYNELNQQYNESNKYNEYGDLYNSTLHIEYILNGTTTNHTLTFNDMITNNIISNSFLYYTKAFQYLNINTAQGFTTTTLQLAKPIPTSNFNWTYNNENLSGVTFDLEFVGQDEDWYLSFASDSASPIPINTNFLLTKQLQNYDVSEDSFDQFILTFNYATPKPVWISNNTNYANSYNNGYNNGYSQARNSTRQEYEPIVNNLRNQIDTLNQQVTSQRVTINALQEQISSISDDYNLNNLMWTIASTPFESFKQIWNVNFLGVNITQMVTGLLTAFIVLYIVKKFFL